MTQSKNIEASFIASFFFLLVSLSVTFGVMLFYAPQRIPSLSDSRNSALQQSANSSAKKASSALLPKKTTNPAYISVSKSSTFDSTPDAQRFQARSDPATLPSGANTGSKGFSPSAKKTAEANQPKDIDALLTEAMRLVDQGNPQAAADALQKILAQDPQNEMALVEMGMIQLIDLKNPQSALDYLKNALKVNPNNKVVLSELVGIYDELGDGTAGLNFLQGLYDERPESPGLASAIGQMMASQNRLNDALPFLERAAEENQSGSAIADLGDTYSQLGMKDKALESYQRVIDLEQEKVESGYYSQDAKAGNENLAMAYMDKIAELVQQKRYSEAEEIMENKVKKIVGGDLKEIAKLFDRTRDSQTR